MEAKKQLEAAWALLEKVPVSGDYVDVMSAVRQKLRLAYKALEEEEHGG